MSHCEELCSEAIYGRGRIIVCLFAFFFLSCTQQQSASGLISQGREVYMANCIACHAPDPRMEGPVGPAIHGASLGLLKARIMSATYPPGYTPKRDSRLMLPLPHLESDLPALEAFLNAE